MLGHRLLQLARNFGDRIAILRGNDRTSYGELARSATLLTHSWGKWQGARVGFTAQDPRAFTAGAAALDLLGAHAFLFGQLTEQQISELQVAHRWDTWIQEPDVESIPSAGASQNDEISSASGLVTILTSGTTGVPKAANHTWQTLARPVRLGSEYRNTRWLLSYPMHLYAGTQVMLQALLNGATLALPVSMSPHAVADAIVEAQVTHASGTPTLWRQILLFASRKKLQQNSLTQVTLGGEASTQDVLDQLHDFFPGARIVHIYASTELGRLFTVTDGREGFPARYLAEGPENGVQLRIVDGQLQARSPNAMIGYDNQPPSTDDSGWVSTGDLVEVRGDRVIFVGRSSDVINVGGAKVHPAVVERVLRTVPGVADVRVYGRQSSMVGQLVAADVQPQPGADPGSLQAEVLRIARETLQPFQVPRTVRIVSKIKVGDTGKVVRKE